MKIIIKRIVPILLAIAVAGCAVWYLFVYDRDFARDMLVSQARYLDSIGRHEMAAWFYDQAYIHADNDASVAIELAQQYKDSGNYTKAEYTLTKAISRGATVELYTALCKTFVEQDKLIDAVKLLDKISDPAMKQEMDALRPAAPTVDQIPGFYNQYITVQIQSNGGTLLYSTDREYPSVAEDQYHSPITLNEGETTVYALSIGENGLVSPLAIYGYTIGSVVEKVTFADAAVEAEVRKILNIGEDNPIYSNDLWTITEFKMPTDALVYSDLSRMNNLTKLTIYNANAGELGFLSSLPKLEDLMITGCPIEKQTLNIIGAIPSLTRLTLAQCSISDIAPLTSLTGLQYLDLSYNTIRDLSALTGMDSLETLYLSHNAITDLTDLSGLSGLKTLNLSYNSITSILPLCSNRNLVSLNVSNNLLEKLSDLDLLPALEKLNASFNKLTDIAVLGGCSGLTELDISNNLIEDIDSLESLVSLMDLNCSYNHISFLPDWSTGCSLIILDASYNYIFDLTPLSQLQSLNRVDLDYNPYLESVSPLASCPNLIQVDLFGTLVTDVSMLTDQSIIVNYNPTEVEVEVPEATE